MGSIKKPNLKSKAILLGPAGLTDDDLSYPGLSGDTERREIKKYVLHRLGSPIVTIELNDDQFNEIYEEIKDFKGNKKEMAFGMAMETLGMIRNKFKSLPIPNGTVELGPDNLIELGISKQLKAISDSKIKNW